LVGAGPGDHELLTLKAMRALQQADVNLHDALVDARVLLHARWNAARIPVGKRAGCKSTARRHSSSADGPGGAGRPHGGTAKGGDPYGFGRGGEERQALAGAGNRGRGDSWNYRRIAAPARAGIPVTDGTPASVALLTGHAAGDCAGTGLGDGIARAA